MSQLPFFKYDDYFTNPVRLLVRESHAIFASIPRGGVDDNRTNMIAISRRYRSIIHECIDNLQRDISSGDHSEQIKTFKELEVVWNLCEILFLDPNQTTTLTIQLRNWIKMHFDQLTNDAKEILRQLDSGTYRLNEDEPDTDYWNLVSLLVLRGETKKAIQLLSCHHEFQRNDLIQLLASMLDSMPLSNQYMAHEFANKWTTWSSWCKRERDTGQFDNYPHLLNIVRLLCQDDNVFEELASKCETWYHLMVAYLLYRDPFIKNSELAGLCRQMISVFKSNHSKYSHLPPAPSQFDQIIIAAFDYDLLTVIASCCAYLDDNWWFVTHFVDLLHSCDQLKKHPITDTDKLRETFLQDYATTLFDDELLWPVGVSYLDNCPTQGQFILEILLSRLPLTERDEDKAKKIISIAKKRGILSIPRSVSLVMSRNWLKQATRLTDDSIVAPDKLHKRSTNVRLPPANNLSNALYWSIRSGEPSLMTYMSDQYLHYYRITRTFPDRSVLDSLRRMFLENERLAFLTKYYEFREICENSPDPSTEAGEIIRTLLASKVYPRFFCSELLEDAKNLLESGLLLRPDNTLDLMRSIEELTREGSIVSNIDLRKNLVRSMARALITPVGSKK